MKEMKVRITFTEEALGTVPADEEIHKTYIASKAPDAATRKEEIEEHGVDEVFEKGMTIFPKDELGRPFWYDYQLKGFFKDACGMLRRDPDKLSSKLKAYKKEIDGLIFVEERQVPIIFDGETGICQRPLRASTPQGERVALASSETVPAGATMEFTIKMFCKEDYNLVVEWLDYGADRGLGQWRNAGKGRFTWEEIAA